MPFIQVIAVLVTECSLNPALGSINNQVRLYEKKVWVFISEFVSRHPVVKNCIFTQ